MRSKRDTSEKQEIKDGMKSGRDKPPYRIEKTITRNVFRMFLCLWTFFLPGKPLRVLYPTDLHISRNICYRHHSDCPDVSGPVLPGIFSSYGSKVFIFHVPISGPFY